MDISVFIKAVVDSDQMPVVICDLKHTIVYMNPAAAERYTKRGGYALVGSSLFDCHNADSNEKIKKVVEWFKNNTSNNRIFTFHNPKENKDVYMVALRDESGKLIGYYEKHEMRTAEGLTPYSALK